MENALASQLAAQAERGDATSLGRFLREYALVAADLPVLVTHNATDLPNGLTIRKVTQAEYDGLTPDAATFYIIVD